MESSSDKPVAVMLPAEKRAVGVVALLAMLRMFGLFALLPVLALHADDLDQATPMLIGLAVGAYGLTQAALQIPFGALSDRIGRTPVIAGGLIIFALGSAVAAMSETIYGVIGGRFLQGAGAISATLTALIADATRERVRTLSMAFFGVGIALAFFLAFFIGPIFASYWGVRSLFWLAAGLAVLGILLLAALPEGIERQRRPEQWSLAPAFRSELLRLDFFVLLLHALMTATFVAVPFLAVQRLQMPVTGYAMMVIGALFVSLFVSIPMILKDKHQGRQQLISIAVVLMLAAQIVLVFAGFSAITVFAGLMLFFAGFTFLEAALPARLSVLADDDIRGASLGVFASFQFFGAFVGGVIGGRFLGAGRPADVFIVCALLTAIWLAQIGLARRNS